MAKRTATRTPVASTQSTASLFKEVKIKRTNPDNVLPIFVNDVVVGHSLVEFIFNFSSIEPPLIIDPQDLQRLKSVDAVTRVKLVTTPKFAQDLLRALSINIENYKKSLEEELKARGKELPNNASGQSE